MDRHSRGAGTRHITIVEAQNHILTPPEHTFSVGLHGDAVIKVTLECGAVLLIAILKGKLRIGDHVLYIELPE